MNAHSSISTANEQIRQWRPAGVARLIYQLGAVLVAGLTMAAAPIAADELDADACLACHGMEGFAAPSGRVLYNNPETYRASTHGSLPCTACHTDITEIPHPEKLRPVSPQVCATCHEDAVNAYRHTVHGRGRESGAPEAATCTDCHGNVHEARPRTDPESPVHWSKMAGTCAKCHASVEFAQRYNIPVIRPVEAYLASAHARAIAGGKHAATCSDCHGTHDIQPSNDPESSIARLKIPNTCGKCHAGILKQYDDSVHGEALLAGHRDAPVCTDCHGEHRILGTGEPTSPIFAANVPGETCGRCHADTRLSEKYGLAGRNFQAFEDSFHGLALRAGQGKVANCASCHGVHDIRPSSDPRSHVNPANLDETCGKCHPGAGKTFKLGPVHGDANSINAVIVGWVRFTYLWLIGLTIGGMVAHNLLDWLRKARQPSPMPVLLLRDEPERMPRAVRWQHGLVMTTFPILVYSGFALKYPESWWAAPLLHFENGANLRRLIHRAAALVMVAALVWHMVHLVVSPTLRACLWKLLPAMRDARVFFGTLAYYFGRRTHPPHSGTFNYAEKAEYWAFMWGSGVMAVTGFALWFANATLRYLPAWVPDAATAVHFYEAILATLAIIVWHFYWVVFDPDVYPMDWTWWTGRPPATRVAERRPLEEEAEDAGPE